MRINTNVASLTANKNLFAIEKEVNASMARLSSGLRINKASDDAAGMAIANNLRTSTRALNVASNNAEQATAMLQIAEGSATVIQRILERQKELYMQSQSANYNGTISYLTDEFTTLSAESSRVIDSTNYQGAAIFNTNLAFTVSDAAVGGTLNISLSLTTASVSITTLSDVSAQLTAVNSVLGQLGAAQNRLAFTMSNVKNAIVNQAAAESAIRDVDVAAEMAEFSKNQVLAQAGNAMLAQANQSSQSVLSLLK
ncbi:MAG: flagellin [Gemmatimonadaceae bacterium]